MEWWNDIVDWFGSTEGRRVVVDVILPIAAVLLAGLVGALIGRGATKRLVAQRDRETRASAVAALVTAATHATTWHSQSAAAREHSQQLATSADIAVRLAPVRGATLAADWAAHELAALRTNSVSFSFAADETLREFRERLVDWVRHPRRAKRLFADDLERWRYDGEPTDPVLLEQQRWAQDRADHAAEAETRVVDATPAATPGAR